MKKAETEVVRKAIIRGKWLIDLPRLPLAILMLYLYGVTLAKVMRYFPNLLGILIGTLCLIFLYFINIFIANKLMELLVPSWKKWVINNYDNIEMIKEIEIEAKKSGFLRKDEQIIDSPCSSDSSE